MKFPFVYVFMGLALKRTQGSISVMKFPFVYVFMGLALKRTQRAEFPTNFLSYHFIPKLSQLLLDPLIVVLGFISCDSPTDPLERQPLSLRGLVWSFYWINNICILYNAIIVHSCFSIKN